jgi:hypothetical protein
LYFPEKGIYYYERVKNSKLFKWFSKNVGAKFQILKLTR